MFRCLRLQYGDGDGERGAGQGRAGRWWLFGLSYGLSLT